jgi:hypothetical protein
MRSDQYYLYQHKFSGSPSLSVDQDFDASIQ